MAVKPVLQALVLAEKIYTDQSGKRVICGTFNGLILKKPEPQKEFESKDGTKFRIIRGGVPGSPYAYLSLTDVCDGTKLSLQFVSLSKNKIIFEKGIQIECKDRLGTVEVVLELPQLPIAEPGVYAFEVVCEGEIIGSARLIAKMPDKDPEGD